MIGHVFYNLPRTRNEIRVGRRRFVFSGIGLPALATLPLMLVAIRAWTGVTPAPWIFVLALACALALSAALWVWRPRTLVQARSSF